MSEDRTEVARWVADSTFVGFCEEWEITGWCPLPVVDYLLEAGLEKPAAVARWAAEYPGKRLWYTVRVGRREDHVFGGVAPLTSTELVSGAIAGGSIQYLWFRHGWTVGDRAFVLPDAAVTAMSASPKVVEVINGSGDEVLAVTFPSFPEAAYAFLTTAYPHLPWIVLPDGRKRVSSGPNDGGRLGVHVVKEDVTVDCWRPYGVRGRLPRAKPVAKGWAVYAGSRQESPVFKSRWEAQLWAVQRYAIAGWENPYNRDKADHAKSLYAIPAEEKE